MPAALLIALPSGLVVSGVATWAVRLCNALAGRGCATGLIVHASERGERSPGMPLHPGVEVFDLTHLPPLESAAGRIETYLGGYEQAAAVLSRHGPVVISPNLVGDCYALGANVVRRSPETRRMVGWLHSDIPYEYHMQRHFEPLVSRFIPVSEALERRAAAALAGRRGDITRMAYGVEVPAAVPARTPIAGRALRLVYAGRLEHAQKRVMSLVHLSRALTGQGVAHELVILGEGPAAGDLGAAIAGMREVVRLGAQPPERVLGVLGSADIAVLPSRYEGLSISMIEAMSRGCVPVVARTNSGAAELLGDGERGVIVDVPAGATDEQAGGLMASGVIHAAARLESLSRAAHQHALSRYSIGVHAEAVARMLEEVAASPPRAWPADRPCAFSGAGGGSVPADGAERLRVLLERLRGRRVVVHGTGRHTRELLETLSAGAASIVAFTDDDPGRVGATVLGRPVVAPPNAAETGATDVVISSWINQEAIWAARDVYESRGLRVHRLYGD